MKGIYLGCPDGSNSLFKSKKVPRKPPVSV
jgi:hypothetical protein